MSPNTAIPISRSASLEWDSDSQRLLDTPDRLTVHTTKCDFCDEFRGGSYNAFAKRYGAEFPNRVIFSGNHFCALPSLGQITEGHLLLVPFKHATCLADCTRSQIEELEEVCRQVRLTLQNIYGECVFFEHGIRNAESGGCGIDHAHVHAVPISARGALEVLLEKFKGSRIRSLSDMKTTIPVDASYLFFEDASAQRFVFGIDKLPSQYMRKLVSESIGKKDWDWREVGKEPDLIATIERLSSAFSTLVSAARG